MVKKHCSRFRMLLVSIILPVGILSLLLTGCNNEDKNHHEDVVKNAEAYYESKYGEKAAINDYYAVGNSGTFGWNMLFADDYVFEMSDGTKVYWDENGGYYADDKQADEIVAAIQDSIMAPALAELGDDAVVSEYTFNRCDLDTFKGIVFRNYFDGDIFAFAKAENLEMRDFTVVISEEDFKGKVERFIADASPYFSKFGGQIAVASASYEGDLDLDTICHNAVIGDPIARADGYFSLDEGVHWIENNYVEVVPSLNVMWSYYDFVLQPGDVTLEQVGTAADLQKMLDDAYYALPVDAERNIKEGRAVDPDQRNEGRKVLVDADAPIYQIRYSDRVKEQINKYGYYFEFMMDGTIEYPLWHYYTDDDHKRYSYTLFCAVEPGESRGSLEDIKEDDLLYFGPVETEEYKD